MATPSEDNGVSLEGDAPSQGGAPSQDPSTRILVPLSRAPPSDRIKIARHDGDVALLFDFPKQFELIVNGKLISDASPIFANILADPPYAPLARSVDNPHVLKVNNWQAGPGLMLVFGVLHGVSRLSNVSMADKKDDAGSLKLLKVAETAKQFAMVEYMKPVLSRGLLRPFVKRSYAGDGDPFRTDAELAAVAYLLDRDEEFSLFTRRLIMDHCVPLSTCASALFAAIPAKAILQLEEQRIDAKQELDELLYKTASHNCKFCKCWTYDQAFVEAIGQKLNPPIVMWPPDYTVSHTFRHVLATIASFDSFSDPSEICCGHASDLASAEEVQKRCEMVARQANVFLAGLCLTCVKENRTQTLDCKHRGTKVYQSDPLA